MIKTVTTLMVGILLTAATGSAMAASLGKAEIRELFQEGNDLFRQANEQSASDPEAAKELYGKAVLRFERILREGGVRNGKLFCNIGNAYFRMGDVGRAILNYRRAERYMPNDPNLMQNIRYACGRRTDRVEQTQVAKILRTLLFWHYEASRRTRSIVFAVCSFLLWIGASLRLLRQDAVPRWVLACAGIVAVLCLGSLVAQTIADSHDMTGVVIAGQVTARKGDSETYQPSFNADLHAGTEFKVLEDRSDWLHIELHDGRRCWLPSKTIELVRLPDDRSTPSPTPTLAVAKLPG